MVKYGINALNERKTPKSMSLFKKEITRIPRKSQHLPNEKAPTPSPPLKHRQVLI